MGDGMSDSDARRWDKQELRKLQEEQAKKNKKLSSMETAAAVEAAEARALVPAHLVRTETPLDQFEWPKIVCTECPAFVKVIDYAFQSPDTHSDVLAWTVCHDVHRLLKLNQAMLRDRARNGTKWLWTETFDLESIADKLLDYHSKIRMAAQAALLVRKFMMNMSSPVTADHQRNERIERLTPAADALREGDVALALRVIYAEDHKAFVKMVGELTEKK